MKSVVKMNKKKPLLGKKEKKGKGKMPAVSQKTKSKNLKIKIAKPKIKPIKKLNKQSTSTENIVEKEKEAIENDTKNDDSKTSDQLNSQDKNANLTDVLKSIRKNVDEKTRFRQVLLSAFNEGSTAAKAARDICAKYGYGAMRVRTAQKWFARFAKGNFDLKDRRRSGRPYGLDEERLNLIIRQNPRQTTRELAQEMNCNHSTVARHLHAIGKTQKDGAWVPHVLSEVNKVQLSSIAAALLAYHNIEAGLSTISKKGKCDDEGHKGDEKSGHENENEVNDEGEGDDDDNIDDEDLPGPSFVGLKRKPHNDSSANGIKKAKINEEQNGEEASSNAKETENSQQLVVSSKPKQDSNTTNGLPINAKVKVENSDVSKNKGEPLPKDVAQENKSQELIDINVDEYDSVESLSALGLDRLKYALEVRGLKCGGSLDERAKRLFSIKGLKANEYPKSLLASHSKKRH